MPNGSVLPTCTKIRSWELTSTFIMDAAENPITNIGRITCHDACGCHNGLNCDHKETPLEKFRDGSLAKKEMTHEHLEKKMDDLVSRSSRLGSTRDAFEFTVASLNLVMNAKHVDEAAVAKKAYRQAKQMFPDASDTTPVKQPAFKRVYKDTLEELKKKKSLERQLAKYIVE